MSPGIAIELHWWRGVGLDQQLSLFYFGIRLGVITLSVQRDWVLARYRQLRSTMEARAVIDHLAVGKRKANRAGGG